MPSDLPTWPRALLLDLDGTLIDSLPDLAGALDDLTAELGLPPVTATDLRPFMGEGARVFLPKAFAAAGLTPPENAIARYLQLYIARIARLSRPFPGVIETLEAAREAGQVLAVCTNKTELLANKVLEELAMSGLFALVAGGDSYPVRKPDPGHLTLTLERLGLSPSDAVMVGDSIHDVKAAKAAGIPCVAVTYGYSRIPAADLGADAAIEAFAELPAACARLRP